MALSKLEEFLITYKGTDGKPLVTVANYYDTYVKPLSKAFQRGSLTTDRTVVCCFHDDINPSLGTIKHKHLKDVYVYHCFGCGAAGTVVRMHQLVEAKYHNRRLNEHDAVIELCSMYNIPLEEIEKVRFDVSKYKGYSAKEARILNKMDAYTVRDYQTDLLDARNPYLPIEKRIEIINKANIRIIATKKKLYED